jgi:C-terminal processing protease CtpA/Prc
MQVSQRIVPTIVTIETDTYEYYLPPTGHALADGIGYIDIPLYRVPGRVAEFASTANAVISSIDQSPTCGWIVDLRLNLGGSYSPMVSGAGKTPGASSVPG